MIDAATTRAVPVRVALVTCSAVPDLDPDDRLLVDRLAVRGVSATPAVWDDPGVDWASYELVVLRSSWDYTPRRDRFVAWARGIRRLLNPADVVEWNTDKRYLRDLVDAGVPVVSTTWVEPDAEFCMPTSGEWVIKPVIGGGSKDAGRYDAADPEHRALGAAHVARLQAAGRRVMVQPYLPAVDTYGETAVLFLGGEYSHSIRKGPLLTGPDQGDVELYRDEEITARLPTPSELSVAEKALAVVPGGPDRLLYARIDLIPGLDGEPLLVELELTEPSLFLRTSSEAPDLLADAIVDHLA